MPSLPHELPLLIFRNKPEFLLSLLNQARGVDLPPYSALRIEETDFTQLEPAQYRADLVITARDEASRPTFALVVEVQRSVDEAKWFSWPVYAGNLHARMRCKTALLVVASFSWPRGSGGEMGAQGSVHAACRVQALGAGAVGYSGDHVD